MAQNKTATKSTSRSRKAAEPKPEKTDLEKYLEMRLNGSSAGEALKETGLGHAKAEYYFLRNASVAKGGLKEKVGSRGKDEVRAMRDDERLSWGQITVLCGFGTEGQCRKAYTEATGSRSQGLRTGKGGRFFLNEETLYNEGLEASGTRIPKDAELPIREAAKAAATEQKMIHKDIAELKEIHAKEVGGKCPNTKALIVRAIVKKRSA